MPFCWVHGIEEVEYVAEGIVQSISGQILIGRGLLCQRVSQHEAVENLRHCRTVQVILPRPAGDRGGILTSL